MRCKLLSLAAAVLAVSASTATAQGVAVQTQPGVPVPPIAVQNGVAVPAPPVVVHGTGSPMVLYPTNAPPVHGGNLSAMTPTPTVAAQQTIVPPAPAPMIQTNVYTAAPRTYTPTYYWYYYQPPYEVQYYQPVAVPVPLSQSHWAPAPTPATDFWTGAASSPAAGRFGPMSNARGELGHARYPYYSYRRPWYYPGQPSFNVTIDGPVW